MSRKRNYYWYCPAWSAEGQMNPSIGISNVGNDIVVPLIDTDWAPPGDPVQDNFVVERIIGQFLLHGDATAPAQDRIVHHRVYVADSDSTSIALRNLYTQDDADTSFLWHLVDGFSADSPGNAWGNWKKGAASTLGSTFMNSRLGSFDIRVGRRVEEGQTLLWHTSLENPLISTLDDNEFSLMYWCRLLMREG